jgi:hypothetical protein
MTYERFVVDDASHRTHRRLSEEGEQHDCTEQLGSVVVVAGAGTLADVGDLGEEDIKHQEQE